MSIREGISNFVRGVVEAARDLGAPEITSVRYPPGSPGAGDVAKVLVRERGANGTATYREVAVSPEYKPQPVIAPLSVAHKLEDVDSVKRWLGEIEEGDAIEAFLSHPALDSGELGEPARLVVFPDIESPELGTVEAPIHRHPTWLAFVEAVGVGEPKDLTHEELYDLVSDYAKSLDDPGLPMLVSRFKGVRSVTYDASLDRELTQGVRVAYQGSSTDDRGAPLNLPREILARVPAYVGPWDPNTEPGEFMRIAMQVRPSRDGSGAPRFRMRWENAEAYEEAQARNLTARVREVLAGVQVLRGEPEIKHVIVPSRRAERGPFGPVPFEALPPEVREGLLAIMRGEATPDGKPTAPASTDAPPSSPPAPTEPGETPPVNG